SGQCTQLHTLHRSCVSSFPYTFVRPITWERQTVGTNGQPDSATNLTYTKFIFVLPLQEDAATLARIRAAGSNVSRGFFNDYDADGTREVQPQETIQFLQAEDRKST